MQDEIGETKGRLWELVGTRGNSWDTADKWFLGPIIAVAAMNGLCIFMAWLFAKRATQKDSYAFVFAIILGVTAAHMLFGSLTETYVFGMTSLILFFVLVQADEKRFSVLVPAGILVFGITVTNIAQSMIALFFKKFGFWKLVYYGVIVLTISIALTAFVSVLYPGNQTFFWVPADLAFEGRFSKPIYVGPMDRVIEKFGVVGRAIFFHGVVAPTPIEDFTRKTTDPLIDFKTHDYHEHVYATGPAEMTCCLAEIREMFIFNRGNGSDVISDVMTNPMTAANDMLIFGDTINSTDAELSRIKGTDDLVINVRGTTDQVTVRGNFFMTALGWDTNFSLDNRIETFVFNGDGAGWSWQQLQQNLISSQTTSGDDNVVGFGSDDVFESSAGNDYLSGGNGGDVYRVARGIGFDIIQDNMSYITIEGTDSIEFASDITPGWPRRRLKMR